MCTCIHVYIHTCVRTYMHTSNKYLQTQKLVELREGRLKKGNCPYPILIKPLWELPVVFSRVRLDIGDDEPGEQIPLLVLELLREHSVRHVEGKHQPVCFEQRPVCRRRLVTYLYMYTSYLHLPTHIPVHYLLTLTYTHTRILVTYTYLHTYSYTSYLHLPTHILVH